MTQPTIATVDAKINSFISSQDKYNDTITKAVDKISTAMSNLNTVHTEINHLTEKLTTAESRVEALSTELKAVNEKVIVNTLQTSEFKHMKKMVAGFIIATIRSGGALTKLNSDNNTNKDRIMQQQADAVLKIAKSIDSKLDK